MSFWTLANTVLPEDSSSPFLSQPTISLKAICVACSPVQLLYTRTPLNPFSLSFTSCTSPFNTHTDQRNDSELDGLVELLYFLVLLCHSAALFSNCPCHVLTHCLCCTHLQSTRALLADVVWIHHARKKTPPPVV